MPRNYARKPKHYGRLTTQYLGYKEWPAVWCGSVMPKDMRTGPPSPPLCAWSTRQNSDGKKRPTSTNLKAPKAVTLQHANQPPMMHPAGGGRGAETKTEERWPAPFFSRTRVGIDRFLEAHLLKRFVNGEANSSNRGAPPPPPPALPEGLSSCATLASQRSTTSSAPYHSSGLSTEWKTPSSVTCSAPSRCANTSGTQESPVVVRQAAHRTAAQHSTAHRWRAGGAGGGGYK